MHPATGTETARPFVPARDFELSKRFYTALGFAQLLDGEVAIFRIGTSSFILQNYFQKAWAENFMMQLMVDDLDAWWMHLVALDLPRTFGVPAPQGPRTAAVGSAHRLRRRSVRCALARRRTTAQRAA